MLSQQSIIQTILNNTLMFNTLQNVELW